MGIMAIMACLISKLQIWVPFEESARIRNIRILRMTIRIIHVQFGLSNYHYDYPSTIRTIRLQLGLSNYNWDFSSTIRIIRLQLGLSISPMSIFWQHLSKSKIVGIVQGRSCRSQPYEEVCRIPGLMICYIYIYYYIPKNNAQVLSVVYSCIIIYSTYYVYIFIYRHIYIYYYIYIYLDLLYGTYFCRCSKTLELSPFLRKNAVPEN